MRLDRFVGIGFLVLAACSTTATGPRFIAPQPQTGQRSLRYSHEVKLFSVTNGLKVAVVPERNTNLVKVDVRYRVGAAEDPRGKGGLAHLVEHMLFTIRAASGEPTLGERLTRSALSWNAYTNWDETHYTATALAAQLPELLAIERARMSVSCAQLDDATFARERQVVEQELHQRGIASGDKLGPVRQALFGRDHAYTRSVGGTAREVTALTRDDACRFVDQHYAPSRAIMVISGNVSFESVRAMVGPMFGPIQKRASGTRAAVGAFRSGKTSRVTLDLQEAALVMAFREPRWGSLRNVVGKLLIDRLAIGLYTEKKKSDFITGVAATRIAGYRGGAIVFVISVKKPSDLPRARAAFTRARKTAFGAKLDPDVHRELVARQQAALLRWVEPFSTRAAAIADYLQYTEHRWLMLADLRGLAGLTEAKARQLGTEWFAGKRAHAIEVIPAGTGVAPRRLDLSSNTKTYDIEMWREPVRASDANKPLALPPRGRSYVYEEMTLDNGLRVVLVPFLAYPVVDMRMVFPAGRAHEPARKRGLASWSAQLLDINYARKLSPRDYNAVKFIFGTGGDMTTDVGEVSTSFHIRGLSMYADAHLWRLYYLLHHGVYPKKDVAARKIAAAMLERDPAERQVRRLLGNLNARLYGNDHPYTRQANSGVGDIGLDDLRRFRAKHYRVRGATLIVTGSFDADDMRKRIRRLFGVFGGGGSAPAMPTVPPARPAPGGRHLALLTRDGAQARVLIAFPTNRGFRGKRAARRVLREMLKMRLARVRQKLGVSYGVEVSYVTRRGPGTLMVSSSLAAGQAGRALKSILDALAELRQGTNLAEDFVRARRKVLERALASTVDSDTVGDELEFVTTHGLSFMDGRKLAAKIARMTPASIRALIGSEMARSRMIVMLSGGRAAVQRAFAEAGVKNVQVLR